MSEMGYKELSPMTPKRWIANLLEAATAIADKQHQEIRWLAVDAYAWERPEELMSVLFDDCVFEGFLDEHGSTFTEEQRSAAVELRDEVKLYCDSTPQWLDPKEVLADPRWEAIRQKAAAFVAAFKGKWPIRSPHEDTY
jgi:hypothetical protein